MLIAIEGCIGAGKSTVAQGLAAYRKSLTLLEQFENNPFLNAFYENPTATALETEFSFLLLHFHQMNTHQDTILKREVITDFSMGKDIVYANLNLHDSTAKNIFMDLYSFLTKQLAQPTLVIFLTASTDLLVARIRNRKREFELKVDPSYYSRINKAYQEFCGDYGGRKLQISMDKWDFVKTPDLFRELSLSIDEHLKVK